MGRLRIAAAQLDLVVGDLDGNAARIAEAYDEAERLGADLVAFPELAITGYPPEDLLLRPAFVARAQEVVDKLAARTAHAAAFIGFPELDGARFNSVAVCASGVVQGRYRKHLLPNYSVFDEERYFEPWPQDGPLFVIAGHRVACTICEDAWSAAGPVLSQATAGAELVVNVNASPYHAGRLRDRESVLVARATEAGAPIVYVNLVGGQDELVFDGASMVVDATGRILARAEQFREALLVLDLELAPRARTRAVDSAAESGTALREVAVSGARLLEQLAPPASPAVLEPVAEVYEALVLGTRDYVRKNGFTDVLIALSGGIDSSLVAVIATDALGPERVRGVLMPSRHSSTGSVTDAEALAGNLGITTATIPIEPAHAAFLGMLEGHLDTAGAALAGENLQARVRGTVLMTMSNSSGALVLTTGNKSEMATGYSTLYGDMAGGFAVIKDVPKTLVYALAHERNRRAGRDVIPRAVLEKPPSAELRPGQRDDDSLPPYEELDPVLEGYVERDRSVAELEAEGFDRGLAERVAALVDRAEYKRRQAPPGIRVSPKAFGRDRRLPISNRWRG